MLIEFLVLTTRKLPLETQPAPPWDPGKYVCKHSTSCFKNQEERVDWIHKRFLLRWVSLGSQSIHASPHIHILCTRKLPFPEKNGALPAYGSVYLNLCIFSFHFICVKSRGSIYLSLDLTSLPWTRNWSTLENIWDFTTLGSHILRRGGILCPLSGGDCLFQLFLAIPSTHKAFLRWSSFRTWVLMTLNERLTHGFALRMKNNTVPRKANEFLTLTGSLLSWNIGIPSYFFMKPTLD